MRRMIVAKLNNVTGVLNRFTAVLNRRQINIVSVSAGITENYSVSNITVVVDVDDLFGMEQIIKQLNRLIDVIEVEDLTDLAHVEREVILLKVEAPASKRAEIFTMIDPFRASVIDVSNENITIQATGQIDKIEALIAIVKPYGILNLSRTGATGLERG
ncbi:acetolactate synthase small subunit [Lactococcus hircilactis]|uniref:Acetolactate synthase small subunit n=1 Tax=Lactococcus hircilactis TaxID=1494462 RepID=A0A7X1ZAG0_9LACT|nr:acetolactate synthase small subunit [Lactococcus hircilactis]MQW40249.1 acetolactate synthase small subunit [Lactococcus hircilactis]